MSVKTQFLSSALVLALLAGTAQAAIDTDGGALPFAGSGAGELFLSAISRADQKSITIDLGVTASAFLANPALGFSQTYAPLKEFIDSAKGPVAYNIGGISNVNVLGGADPASWGLLSTASAPIGKLPTTDLNQIAAAMSNAANFKFFVNEKAGSNDVSRNEVVVETNPSLKSYHDGGFWGQVWGGAMPFTTEELISRALPFYFVGLDLDADPSGGASRGVNVLSSYVWSVSGDGMVQYSAVPLPAGVWLLGSALVGALAFRRRRRA
jgi:hypothetical protein